jgi:hypothetical protein
VGGGREVDVDGATAVLEEFFGGTHLAKREG